MEDRLDKSGSIINESWRERRSQSMLYKAGNAGADCIKLPLEITESRGGQRAESGEKELQIFVKYKELQILLSLIFRDRIFYFITLFTLLLLPALLCPRV